MNDSLWQDMMQLEQARTPYVLVTVVRSVRPSSARPGMRALVTADGRMRGFVGGQCTRHTVVEVALEALRRQEPCLVHITPDPVPRAEPGVTVRLMTCASGGQVELYVEPHQPAPILAVVGGTPIAAAAASLGRSVGYDVRHHVWEPPVPLEGFLARMVEETPSDAAWLVASQGEYDEDAIIALAPLTPPYLGVVASPRRAARMRDVLREASVSETVLADMAAPAGLDLGAVTPAEIAVTILAQLMERRRHKLPTPQPVPETDTGQDTAGEGDGNDSTHPRGTLAIDPVCGMSVDLATTPHLYSHQGMVYGFCCRGCRDAFAKAPEAYAAKARP